MKPAWTLPAALFLLAAGPAIAQPTAVTGARVTVETLDSGGLAGALRRLGAGAEPVWVAWDAPIVDARRRMCCCDGSRPGRCALAGEQSFTMNGDEEEDAARAGKAARFLLFARLSGGRVERLRYFSSDCRIEAGSAAVRYLESVAAEESVAWLESLVPGAAPSARAARRAPAKEDEDGEDDREDSASERIVGPAVASIALIAGPAAGASLDRLIAPDRPYPLRKKTAFWLAAARGVEGCRRVEAAVPSDANPSFRKSGTFAFSLCRDGEATLSLISMARKDASPKVRSQAIFWLAQKAGRKASATIEEAVRDDPDTEVKKQAVFAFTQMPNDEGIPELIRIARTNRNPEVRERAVFWLGQSSDPRALDFIEDVLLK